VSAQPVTALVRPSLRGRNLARAHLAGLAVGSALLTAAVFAVTPLGGRAGFLAAVVVVYGCVQTGASIVVEGRRQAASRLLGLLVRGAVLAALVPLLLVLGYTVARGAPRLSPYFLTHSMRGIGPLDAGGGIYHAIVGTIEQVVLSSLLAVPLGLLAAIYVTEYGGSRLATAVRFVTDVMTGVPSIVSGLFILAFWVIGLHRGFSGFAGALALSILMLPVVIRSAEEMIRLVPDPLREASYALGIPRWRTILSVVLPTASAGITTGVMLAVARVTGETAPLLLTTFGLDAINTDPFHGQQSALPLYIFGQATSSAVGAVDRAWAAALTLIIIVLGLYVLARLVTRRNSLLR